MLTFLLTGALALLVVGLNCCLYLSDVTLENDFWGNADDVTEDVSEIADSSNYIDEHASNFNQVVHVIVFMSSECLLIVVLIFHVITALIVHIIDRTNLLRNRTWFDRSVCLYYVNLVFEISSLMLDLLNHLHMLTWSRLLSVTSAIVFIQIRMTYSELSQRYRRHFVHRQLVNFVRKEFPLEKYDPKISTNDERSPPDPNVESNEIPESCAICWDLLHSWRKLPCNHCFHETCLTSWMEQNPSCPTCRRSLFTTHSNHPRVNQNRNFMTALRDVIGLFDHDIIQPPNGSSVPIQQMQGIRELQVTRAGLPMVRGMAVRLRQVGDSLTGAPIDNPGASLDLSIRVSLGTSSIRPVNETSPPSSLPPQPAASNATLSSENIARNDSESGPSVESRQVMQSTIRRSFFHFDGSRYLSWLPTVHVELSEMFGEMLVPDVGSTATDTSQPPSSDVPLSTAAGSGPQNQMDGSQQPASSSLLSMLISMFRGTNLRSSSSSAVRSSLLLTPELRTQAEHISAMFPNAPLESILLDLASTGVPEATVENILSGQIPNFSTVTNRHVISQSPMSSEPSAYATSLSNDVEIRRRVTLSNQNSPHDLSNMAPSPSIPSSTSESQSEVETEVNCISPARKALLERRNAILTEARRKFLSRREHA